MRKLKVPGRIIGKEIPASIVSRVYFYPESGKMRPGGLSEVNYRFQDDTDLPLVLPDREGIPQDPIIIMANSIRTIWNSPWRDDPELKTRLECGDDVDRDGRDRMGMPVKEPELNEGYIRRVSLIAHISHAVGILADGSMFPDGRCWCWRTRWSSN